MSLKLKMELQDIKAEQNTVSETLSLLLNDKINEKGSDSIAEFETFFSTLGFSVTQNETQEIFEGVLYPVRHVTAKYQGLSFEMSVPDANIFYMGTLSVLTIKGTDLQELNVLLMDGNKIKNYFPSKPSPKNDEEKIEAEIEYENFRLQELYDKKDNIASFKINYGIRSKEKTQQHLAKIYDSLTSILNEYIK